MLTIGKIKGFNSVIMTFQNFGKLTQRIIILKIIRGKTRQKSQKIPFFSFAFGMSLFLWGRIVGGQVWILICCAGSLFPLLSHPIQIFTLWHVERHRNRCFEGFLVQLSSGTDYSEAFGLCLCMSCLLAATCYLSCAHISAHLQHFPAHYCSSWGLC